MTSTTELHQARLERQRLLTEAITRGDQSEVVHKIVEPILSRFKARIVDNLCKTDPGYQNIDNEDYIRLHCELRVITNLLSEITTLVDRGETAREALREESNPPKQAPGRAYRF